MQLITLRGAVVSKFGTIQKFAEAVGWSQSRTLRILNKKQNPTDADIDRMANALEIHDFSTFMQIFFDKVYTSCTKNTA